MRPEQLKDGSFEIDLPIPANILEYGKKYTVGTIAAHDLSVTNRSLDYSAMFEITTPALTVFQLPAETKASRSLRSNRGFLVT